MAASSHSVSSVRIQSFVRGYHVYNRIWTPFIGEVATTTIENSNPHNRHAIAVLEGESLCCVGHIPREISRDCAFFIRTGGTINVVVTGERKRSALPQGGMEIPCVLLLKHANEMIVQKAKKLLSEKGFQETPVNEEPTNKKRRKTDMNAKSIVKQKAQRQATGRQANGKKSMK